MSKSKTALAQNDAFWHCEQAIEKLKGNETNQAIIAIECIERALKHMRNIVETNETPTAE